MKSIRSPFSASVLTALAAALLFSTSSSLRAQDPGYNGPPQDDQSQQADPPSRVGRLSIMQGNVSFQPATAPDFSAAELNYPLTTGDRLYTDAGAFSEVQAGQMAVRLGGQTDFTVTSLTDQLAQFGLAEGSMHLRSFSFDPATATEIDTPNASVNVLQAGDIRVDVYPQDNITIVTVLSGQVQINADGVQQTLQQGQSIQIAGSNPATASLVGRARPDGLDNFSSSRDSAYQQELASEDNYVDPNTIGAADLASYGDWDNSSPDYGAVWYPRGVAVDWAPYSNGRWVSVAPWGWTWVGAEPWGFAPFHYGRWNRFGNRWGWIPGPPRLHPIYSPALVVFVGGNGFAVGGVGAAAWFPLGPGEVYRPWYRTSTLYVNRVNVTNIYSRNTVQIRSVYNNRGDFYGSVPNRYVNRSVATIAVSQSNFGSGRPVRGATLRVDQRQLQDAAISNRPPVAPTRQAGPRPPARALPTRTDRPVLDTRGNDNQPQGNRGGFNGGRPGQPTPGASQQPNRGGNAPAEIVRPASPQQQPGASQPTRNGFPNGGRDNGNGRGQTTITPVQPSTPLPQPTHTQPIPSSNGNPKSNDRFARPGPDRQPAPGGPVRMDQQPTRPQQPAIQPQREGTPQPQREFQPAPQREFQPQPQRQAPPVPQREVQPQPQPQPQREIQPQRQAPLPPREVAPPQRQAPPPQPRPQPAARPEPPRPQPADKKQ